MTDLPIRIRRELAANLTERDRATVEQARHLARRLRAALRRRRTHSSICQHERVLLVRLQRQRAAGFADDLRYWLADYRPTIDNACLWAAKH